MSPAYAAGTLLAVGSVLWLRGRLKDEPAGLILAVLLPGAIYVSYQNFGNDPLWLLLWGLVLFVLAQGQEKRRSLGLMGALALAFVAAPTINIAMSPLRHILQPQARACFWRVLTCFRPSAMRHARCVFGKDTPMRWP